MDAYTSRTFWGVFAAVFMALFVSMAISTFSYDFSYAPDTAAEQGHYITACSPVGALDTTDPLTSNEYATLSARAATLTANSGMDDDCQQAAVIVADPQLPVSQAAFVSDLPLSEDNITLTVNTSAILIE